jgi:serine/threonine-protein kinase HipA
MGTTETIINMVSRFSTDRRGDLLEAIRRVTVDVLLGNGDNHLKNWSFRFPEPGNIRLSPAYDIVPTVLFMPGDHLALPFVGTRDFARVNLHRFERVAGFLRSIRTWVLREVRETVGRALDIGPPWRRNCLGKNGQQSCLRAFPHCNWSGR